jgi:pimeloyl-ACP methyl ester carboxylesterase
MPPEFWSFMEKGTFADMPQIYKDEFLRLTPDSGKLLTMYRRDQQRMLTFKDWNTADIRAIKAPTLIVASDQDVVRPEHAVEMLRLLPKGRLMILPGRHGEFFGEAMYPPRDSKLPERFAAMVDEFLAEPAP